MKLEAKIAAQLKKGTLQRPGKTLQGITKDRIDEVLTAFDQSGPDQIDAVFALLDNNTSNWFGQADALGLKFCNGASTAHIACHIGILQRKSGKLDREGRDAWLKPLWEIGALEKVYFDNQTQGFVVGHPVAKSPNSAYRIASSFLDVLKASGAEGKTLLETWGSEEATRARLQIQAKLAETAKTGITTQHETLIESTCEVYVPKFLPGYEVLYIDATDGARVTEKDVQNLADAGVKITLADSMPDVLLWNKTSNSLWVIEVVTSDGEVDLHKFQSLTEFARRNGNKTIGFTTVYSTWKVAAVRQGKHKNIAPGTKIWIHEDGSKQFTVESFESSRLPTGQ